MAQKLLFPLLSVGTNFSKLAFAKTSGDTISAPFRNSKSIRNEDFKPFPNRLKWDIQILIYWYWFKNSNARFVSNSVYLSSMKFHVKEFMAGFYHLDFRPFKKLEHSIYSHSLLTVSAAM